MVVCKQVVCLILLALFKGLNILNIACIIEEHLLQRDFGEFLKTSNTGVQNVTKSDKTLQLHYSFGYHRHIFKNLK